jgi:hypothetical protein
MTSPCIRPAEPADVPSIVGISKQATGKPAG